MNNHSKLVITNYAMSWKTCLGGLKSSFKTLVEKRKLHRVFIVKYHANFAVLRSRHLPFVYIDNKMLSEREVSVNVISVSELSPTSGDLTVKAREEIKITRFFPAEKNKKT